MNVIPNPSPMAKLSSFISKMTDDVLINDTKFIDTDNIQVQYSWSLARVFFWCAKYLFRNTYSEQSNI